MIHPRARNTLLLIGALLLWSRSAAADQVHYVGIHPVAAAELEAGADAFCYIEVPHVHIYKPQPKTKVLYRVHDDNYHFVGDPVGFGYDGDKHPYYGHHPVRVDVDVDVDVDVVPPDWYDDEYCYLDGPHYHPYEPPADIAFEFKGDAYWYVGDYSPRYRKHRKRLARVNAIYTPLVYERPVVVVDSRPAAYSGPVVGVEVRGPAVPSVRAGVEVVVPTPTIDVDIGIGLPGVMVIENGRRGHRHKHWKKHKKHKKWKKHKKFRKRRW